MNPVDYRYYRGDERRRAGFNGMPWWVQAISVLGFPVVVAMLLLGMFMGFISSPITESRDMLKSHTAGEWERARLLRVMCRHQALALKASADECDTGR